SRRSPVSSGVQPFQRPCACQSLWPPPYPTRRPPVAPRLPTSASAPWAMTTGRWLTTLTVSNGGRPSVLRSRYLPWQRYSRVSRWCIHEKVLARRPALNFDECDRNRIELRRLSAGREVVVPSAGLQVPGRRDGDAPGDSPDHVLADRNPEE